MRNLGLACILLAICLITGGCLVTANNTETQTGNYVAQSTIDQIEVNSTTKEWVSGILGQPTSKVVLSDSSEIWKYSYTETHEKEGAVFLIFGGQDTKTTDHTLFLEFHGDVVSRRWVG